MDTVAANDRDSHGPAAPPHGPTETPHGREQAPHGSEEAPRGSEETPRGRATTWRAAAVDLGALGLLFALLAAVSWRRWADPHVDFGQQLHVAWQLCEGAVLYRDLAYLHGPLSPYVNASLFRLFGVSYTTLIFANLAVTAATALLLYRTFGRGLGRAAGLAAAAVFLSVFAFGQYVGVANYNWISPYEHGATHGVLLFGVMAHLLGREGAWSEGRSLAIGLSAGLLLLTRAELALASLAAALGMLLVAGGGRGGGRPDGLSVRRRMTLVVGGVALPPLLAFGAFSFSLPAPRAARAVAGAWVHLPAAAGGAFFARGAGLDDLWLSAQVTVAVGLSASLLVALAIAAGMAWRSQRTTRGVLAATSTVAACVVLYAASTTYTGDLGRGLPLLAFAPVLVWGHDLRRRGGRRTGSVPSCAPFLWALFGLLMLGKTGFAARIHHYGFYLSMGAVVSLAVLLVAEVPRRVARAGGSARSVRLTMVLLGTVLAGRFVTESLRYYGMKTESVGAGGDEIVTYRRDVDPRTEHFAEALRFLSALPSTATVQVLPEGVMLNYLSRRTAPSRFTNFMVTEVDAYGEAVMLEDLRDADPDYVVLVHKETSEYGVGYFGTDPRYGRSIMAWVRRDYERVRSWGAEPLRRPAYGIEVLRRAGTSGSGDQGRP